MLQGLFGKVMAGLLSFSALMFFPHQGNHPQFQPLQCSAGHSYLQVSVKLNNAFDNDFPDVFKCGKPIHLWYKIGIRLNGETVHSALYRHTVTYDPMNAAWELFSTESSHKEVYTSYSELIKEISVLECSIPRDSRWQTVEITAESWLQPVELSQPHRTVDLMVLWQFKRPSARKVFTLPPTS
jgi:hypothetical protein